MSLPIFYSIENLPPGCSSRKAATSKTKSSSKTSLCLSISTLLSNSSIVIGTASNCGFKTKSLCFSKNLRKLYSANKIKIKKITNEIHSNG